MQRRYQLGMSSTGIMMLVMMFAFIVKVSAVVAPAYYDNYTINKIIDSLYRDGRAGSIDDFKRALGDRFSINNIAGRTPEDFIYSIEDKKLTVVVDYEVRKNFVANLDVVMHFKQTHTAGAIDSDN
jgi:hypothetical protein